MRRSHSFQRKKPSKTEQRADRNPWTLMAGLSKILTATTTTTLVVRKQEFGLGQKEDALYQVVFCRAIQVIGHHGSSRTEQVQTPR